MRIGNYNAPEKYQFGGKTAQNRLRGLIGRKTISFTPVGKSYGRTVVRLNRNLQRKLER